MKLGDVNIHGIHVGINVTSGVRTQFDRAIQKYYLREKRSLNDTFTFVLADHYSEDFSVTNGRLTPNLISIEKRPTFAQFYYHFTKNYRKIQCLRGRLGSTYVEQNCRAVTRDQTKSAMGIGDIYQIDATTADVHLVSSIDTQLVVGRPIVYFVIDAFSELVAGVHVTFSDMSYNAVAMAIWNAYTDKVQFCESMGVRDIRADHWPSKGLPASLFADRGELASRISDVVAKNLNIRLSNAPAYCPTAKAIVERHFGLINGAVVKWLPGAIPTDDIKPLRGDYRKKAALTMQEFSEALIQAVLSYNISTRTDYKLTQAMIRDHVEPIPCRIWEWGLANHPQLHGNDLRMVRLGLLPIKSGTVRRDGINFAGLRYTCKKATVEQWFDSQKAFGRSWKLKCSYDPNMTDYIYLLGPTFADTEICHLTDADATFAGWSWAEVGKYHERKAKYLLAREDPDRRNRVASQSAIRQITIAAEARRKNRGAPDVTNIASARIAQQAENGEKDALETMKIIGVAPLQPSPLNVAKSEKSNIAAHWAMICEESQRNGESQAVL